MKITITPGPMIVPTKADGRWQWTTATRDVITVEAGTIDVNFHHAVKLTSEEWADLAAVALYQSTMARDDG